MYKWETNTAPHILSAKVGTLLLNQAIFIISCYKKYHKMFYIKTFTADFVSIMKTKQVVTQKQQVQWSGSLQQLITEQCITDWKRKKKKKLFIARN